MTSVLIVDDDPVHRMVISRIAKTAGHRPLLAANLDEAHAALADPTISCITLDLNLGMETGSAILDAIGACVQKPRVILISGSGADMRQHALDTCAQLGIFVIDIPKPIDLAKLKASLGVIATDLATAS